jgi:predicted GIY-YIG superfamily endonuclease
MFTFLYILQSIPSSKYYVGVLGKPETRLTHHNKIEKGLTLKG